MPVCSQAAAAAKAVKKESASAMYGNWVAADAGADAAEQEDEEMADAKEEDEEGEAGLTEETITRERAIGKGEHFRYSFQVSTLC